jgi:SulP family sulfate permease
VGKLDTQIPGLTTGAAGKSRHTQWSSFRFFGKIPHTDVFVGILVAALTVLVNITLAVIVGVIIAALVFAWQHAKQITVHTYHDEHDRKVYAVEGTLFFASVAQFSRLFSP